jgi:hypothetical protein
MTEDQQFCKDMLSEWVGGDHHLPKVHGFEKGICINFCGDLSTHDGDRLTRLVLLAHRDAVRIEIASSGPRRVKIIAHRRKHGTRETLKFWEFHPTLTDLSASALQLHAISASRLACRC